MNYSPFAVRLPEELRNQIKEVAQQEDRSEGNVIKIALREWLARRKEQEVKRQTINV